MSQARRFVTNFMYAVFGARRWQPALVKTGQALLLGAVVVWPLLAEDSTAESERRIRAALESPTTLNFTDTPLADAMAFLGDAQQVLIHLDTSALDEAGIGTDTPITANLSGVSLRSALHLLLDPLKLEPVVHEGVLLITTSDEAQNMLNVRVYPAADLLGEDAHPLITVIVASIAPDLWDEVGGRGSLQRFDDLLIIRQTDRVHDEIGRLLTEMRQARAAAPVAQHQPQAVEDAKLDEQGMVIRTYTLGGEGVTDSFAQLVTSMVAPSAWSENGGQGTIRRVGPLQFGDGSTLRGALIVRQTPEVHMQLDRFLGQLKSLASPMRYPKPVARGGFGGGGMGRPAASVKQSPTKPEPQTQGEEPDPFAAP